MLPNADQMMGICRAFIPGLAAAIAHWGLGTDAQNTVLLTAAATGLVASWSTYSNSQSSMIKSINTADNGVHVVPTATAPAATVDKPLK